MATIQFENGAKVEFDGDPTPEDIDEVARNIGISQTPESKEFPTFKSRVAEAYKQRFDISGESKIGQIEERFATGRQSFAESALQIAGQGVAGLGDILFEAARTVTPEFIKAPLARGVEKVVTSDPVETLTQEYGEFKQRNPRAAGNIEAVFNIGTAIPVVGGARAGIGATRAVSGRAARGLERGVARQEFEEALSVSRKPLNAKEKAQAVASGRAKARIFGQVDTLPSAKDLEIADSVKGLVRANNNPVDNVKNILKEVGVIGARVDKGLADNNAIFNKKQLRSQLNAAKEESRVLFGTEKTIESSYDAVTDEFLRTMNKYPKTVAGLRKGRKEFDVVMQRKFPNVFKDPYSDNVRFNAIKDVRRASDDYIAELLPVGNTYRDDLLRMSNMYRATENIGKRTAGIVDETIVKKVITALRQNPITHGFTGGILTAAGLALLLSNPIAIGLLMLGGTYKIGKATMNSIQLKKALIKLLDKIESGGGKTSQADKQAVITLLQQMNDFTQKNQVGLSLKDVSKKKASNLETEAANYKTADEFVKAQPKLYHSGSADIKEVNLNKANFNKTFYMSDNADYAKSFGGKNSTINEISLDAKANLADMRKPSAELVSKIEPLLKRENAVFSDKAIIDGIKDGKAHFAELPEVKKALQKLGYDGQITAEVPYAKNIGIWNKDVIKTKSQLTDIWNKARGEN